MTRQLRGRSLAALSTLEVPRRHYRDANGYVYLNRPVTDTNPDWIELTAEQYESVRPLNDTDKRKYDAWHRPKGEDDVLP